MCRRYEGLLTGGLEHEFNSLYWEGHGREFKDHLLVFESEFMKFQWETQGSDTTTAKLEGITKTLNVAASQNSKERRLEVLSHALFNWWEYGFGLLFHRSTTYGYRNKKRRNRLLKQYLGLKFNMTEKRAEADAKTFLETHNALVDQNKRELARIAGVEPADLWKIKLGWRRNDGEALAEERAHLLVATPYKVGEELHRNLIRRGAENKLNVLLDQAMKPSTVQLTLTFSLATVPHLFERYDQLKLPQSRGSQRMKQFENALDFADRVLRVLKPAAAGAVASNERTQEKKQRMLKQCDKLRGLLALLYVQLHGFSDRIHISKKLSKAKAKKKLKAELKHGLHFRDTISPTASFVKDFYCLLPKTPLRSLYVTSLSQRDKALLALSGAHERIPRILMSGKWDAEGWLLKKYIRGNPISSRVISQMQKYIKYVLCPIDSVSYAKNNPVIERKEQEHKNTMQRKKVLEAQLVALRRTRPRDWDAEREREEEVRSERYLARLQESEIKRLRAMQGTWYLAPFTEESPVDDGVYEAHESFRTPNHARVQLLGGDHENVAIYERDEVKIKEVVFDRSQREVTREIERKVLRVAFEFRQLSVGKQDSLEKLYDRLMELYTNAFEGYETLMKSYEQRHGREEPLPHDSEFAREEQLIIIERRPEDRRRQPVTARELEYVDK